MEYLQPSCTDPRWNLALEEYLFTRTDRSADYFMLWQNDNSVVVGKNQNVAEEVNEPLARREQVRVVRRLSGGGAVYHDLGNLNFTFIADARRFEQINFTRFCQPITDALRSMGVPAQISGRNDLTIGGKKFSGNAQWIQGGRVLHHGTLLFSSDLDRAARLLRAGSKDIRSAAIKSVSSRITNIRDHLAQPVTLQEFKALLCRHILGPHHPGPISLSPQALGEVEELKRARYDTWEWNYGRSPRYQTEKAGWFSGCGYVKVSMDVEESVIRAIRFTGDFFGSGEVERLEEGLTGCRMEYGCLAARLRELSLSWYISHMEPETLAELILS